MKKLSIVIALLVSAIGIAQVDVIGPADGLLLDTKTSTVLNGIANPREGLLVGNKTTHSLWYYNGTEFIDLMDVVGGTNYTFGDGLTNDNGTVSVDNPFTATDRNNLETNNTKISLSELTGNESVFDGWDKDASDDGVGSNGVFNNVTVGQSDGQSGGIHFYHPNTLNNPFGNGNMGQGRTFFNGDNFGFMPPDAQFEGYQFVGIPTEIVDIILPTSGTVDLTNIGSGSGGTDDQTIAEVLQQGNEANYQAISKLSSIGISGAESYNKLMTQGWVNNFDFEIRPYEYDNENSTALSIGNSLEYRSNVDAWFYKNEELNSGSGSGTDDQTLAEVLSEGNVINSTILVDTDGAYNIGDLSNRINSINTNTLFARSTISSGGDVIADQYKWSATDTPENTGLGWSYVDLSEKYLYIHNGTEFKKIPYFDDISSGGLTTDQTNIIANQLKGPVTEIILTDGAFTNSSIRRISGVDISRPVNNIVNSGDITTTLGDLGETSGSLDGEIVYAKVEGNTATWTIEPDNVNFYENGVLLDNKKVFLDTGDNVIFENKTIGGWDIYGSYDIINGFTNYPYSTNPNPNLVTGALAFGNSSDATTPSNTFNSSTVSVVQVSEHPYDNSHAIRITSTVEDSYSARAAFDYTVEDNTQYAVAIARRSQNDARYRFSIGTVDAHDTNFSNTTDFVVDEFTITTTGTTIRLDLYAHFGLSNIGEYAEFFVIIKKV